MRVTWGAKTTFREQDFGWLVNEHTVRYRGTTYSAFVETTRFWGLKARQHLENIGARRNGEARQLHSPDRTRPLQILQIARRADRQWVKITFSRQF